MRLFWRSCALRVGFGRNLLKCVTPCEMDPPSHHGKDTPVERRARRQTAVVDDTTLMMVVTFLYALYEIMSRMNLPECTC